MQIPILLIYAYVYQIPFPNNQWLIENLVPAGGFVILASGSGEKKTWIAMSMANAIATGETFLGEYKTDKGPVLYLNGEMSQREVQRRGRLLQLTQTEDFWVLNQEKDFYTDQENIDWLFDQILMKGIKAVFIDTFRAYAGGIKEEKAEEIRGVYE